MINPAVASPLAFEVVCKGECFVVHCNGKLVAGVGDLLYSQVRTLIPETKRIVLDLTNLTRVDSMGLGTLVRCYASARSAGVSTFAFGLEVKRQSELGTFRAQTRMAVVSG